MRAISRSPPLGYHSHVLGRCILLHLFRAKAPIFDYRVLQMGYKYRCTPARFVAACSPVLAAIVLGTTSSAPFLLPPAVVTCDSTVSPFHQMHVGAISPPADACILEVCVCCHHATDRHLPTHLPTVSFWKKGHSGREEGTQCLFSWSFLTWDWNAIPHSGGGGGLLGFLRSLSAPFSCSTPSLCPRQEGHFLPPCLPGLFCCQMPTACISAPVSGCTCAILGLPQILL